MPDVKVTDNGPPVPSTILVNVDNETVFGDGSLEHPLRASGAAPAPTVENLTLNLGPYAVDATSDVTFVTYGGPVPEFPPATIVVTLPDGTVDGFQKVVVFNPTGGIISYQLTPTNFANGTSIDYDEGTATFVWSTVAGAWYLLGNFLGSVNP